MATFLVCPIDGALPADNGTNTTPVNNQVNTNSDAVATGSTVIGSATATGLNVTTGANFPVGTWLWIPTRKEKLYVTVQASNALTVLRGAALVGGVPTANATTPSAAIALNDVILAGMDFNGQAPHCPICGTTQLIVDPATVTAVTAVAAGSQHPVDVDATYVTNSHETETAPGVTAYATIQGQNAPVYQHGFKSANRGTSTVTAETINTVLGP